ncbi:DUF4124 domain-containing protein [Corallincola spongiicola]|uniref:DUF4124 domain-containing protein n=1 Tax=Corallincola spongiicola TaxID=2520508 RepID=A0ABY1WTM3_9GAMM|nr:DUF4124 domain-containing protein [Corallincola spongiicola]TAA48072.1 DUF4124 domain-containing protein [Corallincola spongiicola]
MKKYLTLLVLLIVCACAGPFFIKGPDGKPLLTTATIFPQDQSTVWRYWKNRILLSFKMLSRQAQEKLGVEADAPNVYRWQDEQGNWHYGDAEAGNKAGAQTEQVKLKPAKIVGLDGPLQEEDKPTEAPAAADGVSLSEYTERLGNIKLDAEEAKRLMEQRNAALEKSE